MARTGYGAAALLLSVLAMLLIFSTACGTQGTGNRLVFEEDFEGPLAGTVVGADVTEVGNGEASALLIEPGDSYTTKVPIEGDCQASFQMVGHIRPDATLYFRAVTPSGESVEKYFTPIDARTWQTEHVDLDSLAGEIATITIEVSEADLESQVLISGLRIVERSAGALTAADVLPYGVLAAVAVSIMLAAGVGVGTYRRMRISVAEGAANIGGLDQRVGDGVRTIERLSEGVHATTTKVEEGQFRIDDLGVRMTDFRRYIEEQNAQFARKLSSLENVQDEIAKLGVGLHNVTSQTDEMRRKSEEQANLFETLSQTVELSSARIDATATEVDQLAERVLANVRETERLVALQARLIHAMVSKSNELDPEGGNVEYADAAAGGHD